MSCDCETPNRRGAKNAETGKDLAAREHKDRRAATPQPKGRVAERLRGRKILPEKQEIGLLLHRRLLGGIPLTLALSPEGGEGIACAPL